MNNDLETGSSVPTKKTSETPNDLTKKQEPVGSSGPASLLLSRNGIKPISVNISPLYEIYETVREDVLNRGTEPKYKIGLKELDEILWGVHKKELLAIGARTSHGKSAFAVNLTKEIVDVGNNRVIYFSLEMSKEQLLERLFCNICGVNNIGLRQGKKKDEFIEKENTFKAWIENAHLLIDDKYGFSFNKMVEICEIIKPDFIIVDYIQMISTYSYRSKLEAIEEYIRKLKELSLEMNFGTILLSQMNRSGGETPGIANFKWAAVIEEHSDTCLILDWDNEEFNVKIVKQRHGGLGDVKLKFLPQYSRFEDKERTDEN